MFNTRILLTPKLKSSEYCTCTTAMSSQCNLRNHGYRISLHLRAMTPGHGTGKHSIADHMLYFAHNLSGTHSRFNFHCNTTTSLWYTSLKTLAVSIGNYGFSDLLSLKPGTQPKLTYLMSSADISSWLISWHHPFIEAGTPGHRCTACPNAPDKPVFQTTNIKYLS